MATNRPGLFPVQVISYYSKSGYGVPITCACFFDPILAANWTESRHERVTWFGNMWSNKAVRPPGRQSFRSSGAYKLQPALHPPSPSLYLPSTTRHTASLLTSPQPEEPVGKSEPISCAHSNRRQLAWPRGRRLLSTSSGALQLHAPDTTSSNHSFSTSSITRIHHFTLHDG